MSKECPLDRTLCVVDLRVRLMYKANNTVRQIMKVYYRYEEENAREARRTQYRSLRTPVRQCTMNTILADAFTVPMLIELVTLLVDVDSLDASNGV